MNVNITNLPKSQVQILITLDPEDFKKYYQRALHKISQEINIKGFRKGKVPLEIVKEHVGADYIKNLAIDEALSPTYAQAVKENNIKVVSHPEIKIISEEPLVYEAIVAVLPEVELSFLDQIKIEKKKVKVTDKDVEDVIENILKRNAKFNDVERKTVKGDRVEVSFEGFDEEGKEITEIKSKRHPIIIGDNMMIPGFEEELIDLEKDQEKEFDITFPKDYHKKKFADKKIKFKVKVLRIEERILPQLDEAFIENISGKKQSLEEWKKLLSGDLMKYREQEAEEERKNEFIEELVKRSKMEIPDQMIEEEKDFILEEIKNDITNKGIPWEKFVEFTEKQNRDLRKENEKQALKRVEMRLAMSKAFEIADIKVEDEELKKEIDHVLSHYPKDQEKAVLEYYEGGGAGYVKLINKLKIEKLFAKYL